jgi:hypothetical protein
MCEVIARCRHDEVEIAIDLLAIALCNHSFQGCGCLLEGGPGLGCISAEFSQAKTKPKKGVAIGMQVMAKLRSESWGIWREHPVSPDDCSRLTARDETASEAGSRRLRYVSRDCFRRCWHWQLLGHRLRR